MVDGMPARQSLAGANPLQWSSRRGQLLDIGPHALLGRFVGQRRLKAIEREHAAALHMGDQTGPKNISQFR